MKQNAAPLLAATLALGLLAQVTGWTAPPRKNGPSPAPVAETAAPAVAPPAAVASTKKARKAISVLAVSQLDDAGKSNVVSLGSGDATLFSYAEEAISHSKAFRLFGRDQWSNQAKEINMNAEGWVTPESAKQFGKAQGIDQFVTVFVPDLNSATYEEKEADGSVIQSDGQIVMGSEVNSSAVVDAGLGKVKDDIGKKLSRSLFGRNASSSSSRKKTMAEASFTIMCRFTDVETGKRITQSFKGVARQDASKTDRDKLINAAQKDAFGAFSKYLWDNRDPLMSNISEVAENKLVAGLGKQDGVEAGMIFEVCERSQIGSFVSLKRVCDARVLDVNDDSALLETGDWQLNKLFVPRPELSQNVKSGFVIREKR